MRTAETTVRRHPERGAYDRATIDSILDEALVCHVGFVHEGRPYVIPTIHARVDDVLYLHGSPASRMLRELGESPDVCVTATLVDGLVLARSVYHHSLNYRSVVVLGASRAVLEPGEKRRALEAVVEHIATGRSREARPPSDKELAGTSVFAIHLGEASAKVRTGPPQDFEGDLDLPVWAGVLPLQLLAGEPIADDGVPEGIGIPRSIARYRR